MRVGSFVAVGSGVFVDRLFGVVSGLVAVYLDLFGVAIYLDLFGVGLLVFFERLWWECRIECPPQRMVNLGGSGSLEVRGIALV